MNSSDSTIGREFAESLLAKNWAQLESLLDDEVDFRGLTPSRPWEATTARSLIDTVFKQWFEPTDDIYEIIDVATGRIADRQRVVYRFRVRNSGGDYVCEQTGYYDESAGKIMKLRILCSGFLPSR